MRKERGKRFNQHCFGSYMSTCRHRKSRQVSPRWIERCAQRAMQASFSRLHRGSKSNGGFLAVSRMRPLGSAFCQRGCGFRRRSGVLGPLKPLMSLLRPLRRPASDSLERKLQYPFQSSPECSMRDPRRIPSAILRPLLRPLAATSRS